jgi:hypothetical protein
MNIPTLFGKKTSVTSLKIKETKPSFSFVVLNSIHPEGQGRQPPAVTAQPPATNRPAASHQLFAATAASRLHT